MKVLGYDAEPVECCPICDGTGEFIMDIPDGYAVHTCKNCGCTYLNPKMTADAMEEYYRSGDYVGQFTSNGDFFERRRAMMRMLLITQFTNLDMPSRVLDVGCGNGHFLMRMRDWVRNVETVGYDLYRRPGRVHEVITDKDEITGEFDFISCIHALEHMYDPMKELEWMNSLLAEGGSIYLELPVKRKIMLEHPVTFTPEAVPFLMEHIGIGTYTSIDVPNLESVIVFGKKYKNGRESERAVADRGVPALYEAAGCEQVR